MEQLTIANEYQTKHKELYDYISGLPTADLIELLNIVFYQDDIDPQGKLKDSGKFRNIYIRGLYNAFIEREYEEDDDVIINNIKQAFL